MFFICSLARNLRGRDAGKIEVLWWKFFSASLRMKLLLSFTLRACVLIFFWLFCNFLSSFLLHFRRRIINFTNHCMIASSLKGRKNFQKKNRNFSFVSKYEDNVYYVSFRVLGESNIVIVVNKIQADLFCMVFEHESTLTITKKKEAKNCQTYRWVSQINRKKRQKYLHT